MSILSRLLTASAALCALAVSSCATAPAAESGAAWTTLIDAQNKGDWNTLGQSNWRLEDGAVVADGKLPGAGGGASYLVTKTSYKDFEIHLEFWADAEANSGVMIRCSNAAMPGDKTCYEVNIYDKRPDPTYGTGGVVHFSEAAGLPKVAGKWNIMDITAKGRDVTVILNGKKTASFRSDYLLEGPFALQHIAGAIKFRKVAIRPL